MHDSPFEILTTSQGKLSQNLPHGNYKVSVVRRGYLSQSFEIDFNSDLHLEVKLVKAATCLLVNDDPNSDFASFYSSALKDNEVSHHSESSRRASNLAQMLSYEKVIWFTGDAEENVLDTNEQNAIQTYLEYGGNLILTGHGIGNDLKNSTFLYKVLGTRYQYQRRLFRNVKFKDSGFKIKLNGDDSADNQSKPDVLKPFSEAARSVLKYTLLGSAGILHRFGTGKVLYLGFGIEGIRGSQARSTTMQQLLEL